MKSKKNMPITETPAEPTAVVAAPPVADIRYERISAIIRGQQDFHFAYLATLAVVMGGRICFADLLRLGWSAAAIGSLSHTLNYYVSTGRFKRLDSDNYLVIG